jgi:hemoglobin
MNLEINLHPHPMKPDIRGLADIVLFVNEFYDKVQQDDLIGSVFNGVIKDWGPHLERMYQFWNAALFSVPGFKGNPFAKHAPLPINQGHFDRWLLLFEETIDANFSGEMAKDTKKRAALMAALFVSKLGHMKGGPGTVLV